MNQVCLFLVAISSLLLVPLVDCRSFVIDQTNNRFLKDGKPFRYISGSIHYSRIHDEYWEDRILKMKAAGLNAVEFYIPWNFHEDAQGEFDFTGWKNVSKFLSIVDSAEMVAIVRIGPYICGEWENGGFPWWLLNFPGIQLRQTNTPYLDAISKWWGYLLPNIIKPMLYSKGGPIVMIQIENEYGYFSACDHQYMKFLQNLAEKHLGDDVVYFTVDGSQDRLLQCGTINGTFATVDFGISSRDEVRANFELQDKYNPEGGPHVNTEYYPGWFDVWGKNPHRTRKASDVLKGMLNILNAGASMSFYMFHGGTNFGYWNGATSGTPYSPVVTSYDYDAPISETGDTTSKFYAIRNALKTFTGVQPPPVPQNTTKIGYGTVSLQNLGPMIYHLYLLSPATKRVSSDYPLSFEDIGSPYGFVLYETHYNNYAKNLSINQVHDRAYVLQDGLLQGIAERDGNTFIAMNKTRRARKIQILVENQGRHNTGEIDRKGVLGNITIDGQVQKGWKMYPIEFSSFFPPILQHRFEESKPSSRQFTQLYRASKRRLNRLKHARKFAKAKNASDEEQVPRWTFQRRTTVNQDIHKLQATERSRQASSLPKMEDMMFTPSIFYGTFPAREIADTFFDPTGWGKGQVFINGYNVGRYWPSNGPQVTLFVPKYFLRKVNTIVMLELERPAFCTSAFACAVSIKSNPVLSKP